MAALLASIRSHAYATPSTRHPGRDAIIELGTDALPIILPLLGEGTSDHAPPSKYIIEILTAMGKPVVNPLLKVLRSGKLVERRRAAIILGYRLQEPRAIVPLANLVVKSPTLRPVAAGALAGIGRPATPAILKLFKVRDASVRAAMLGAAGKSTDPALVAPLLKMLSSRTPSVRVDVFRALVNKKDPRVRAALVKHLQDPDAYVRREAARYLGYYGAREDIQALQRQLAREKDASVQRILLQAVVRLRDS